MKKKVIISTLGCKVNQYESASFLCAFEESGYQNAKSGEDADIVVINTCAVTAKAGAQSRQTMRRLIRRHPLAKVVITGCYAQIAAVEIAAIVQGPLCIIGNANKDILVATALQEGPEERSIHTGKLSQQKEVCNLPIRRFNQRTRAYIRVQDGCNNFCTYCIVPYTRGPSRSVALRQVLEQAAAFENAGHREMVVTGIHVGMYGKDLELPCDIADLIEKLCTAHPQTRFRLSSIEPQEISEKLFDVMQRHDNFMPHFHIPLQSGDDTILGRMHRGYDRETFRRIIQKCLARFPDAAIGCDILAGFPGEDNDAFQNSIGLLEEIGATYLHVFPYSKRPGTPAASYPDQVPKAVSQQRVTELRNLADRQKETFYRRFLGTSRPVLVEHKRNREHLLTGFTDNYIPVSFAGEDTLMGTVVPILLERINEDGAVWGRVTG